MVKLGAHRHPTIERFAHTFISTMIGTCCSRSNCWRCDHGAMQRPTVRSQSRILAPVKNRSTHTREGDRARSSRNGRAMAKILQSSQLHGRLQNVRINVRAARSGHVEAEIGWKG
jgi:hypothetical protein